MTDRQTIDKTMDYINIMYAAGDDLILNHFKAYLERNPYKNSEVDSCGICAT